MNDISPTPQEETQTAYPWLYTFADLATHEENKDIEEIWIITDDLIKRAARYEVREKLAANLRNGVKYRFFVPGTPLTSLELQVLSKECKGLLEVRSFDPGEFYTQAATDYVIIYRKDAPLLAFFRLMIDDGNKDDLWVKVDESSAMKFRDRFNVYWDKGKPSALSTATTAG